MRYLFIALMAGVVALAFATGCGDNRSAADYARERAEIASLERRDRIDEALKPLDMALAAAWRLVPLASVIGALAYLGAWGVAHQVRFRRERWPRQDGLLPVMAEQLADVAPQALGAFHAARQLEAQQQPVPHTITYSPHDSYGPHTTYSPHTALDYRTDSGRAALLPADEPAAGPGLPGVTDLAALGFRPSLESILLALGEGGERITVPARALCHVALVGSTGGGKSNLLRLLLPQLQACGARVVLADPHFAPVDPETGEDWRPIATRLYMAPAVSAGEIGALLDYLGDELARRIELRRAGQRWGPPLFLALDELPVIADTVPASAELLGKLLREGRKVGLYSVGSAQSFLVKVIGGDSSAREAYRTAFYVGGDLKSAVALLDLAQKDIAEGAISEGVAYLRSKATSPARLVRVPLASNAAVTGLLQAYEPAPEEATGKPDVSLMEARSAQASRSSIRPEAARAIELFRAGADLPEIVKELRNVTSSQGRKYQEAAREVQQLLREAL